MMVATAVVADAVSMAARLTADQAAGRVPQHVTDVAYDAGDDLDTACRKAIHRPAANAAHDDGAHAESLHESGHVGSLAVPSRGHGPRRDDLIPCQLGDHEERRVPEVTT